MEDRTDLEYRMVFMEVIHALKCKLAVILAVTGICAILGWAGSSFLISPKYEASVNMIVNTRTDVNTNVTNDNISSAQNLVDTYAIIIKSNTVLNQVIQNLGLEISYEELYECVSVSAINNTQVMKIAVQSDSPETAAIIVQNIALIAPDIVADAVEAGSCKVVSDVAADTEPAAPDIVKHTILAGFLGLAGCISVIVLQEMMKDHIVDAFDVENTLGLSALGVIPDVEAGTKRNLKGNKRKHQKKGSFVSESSASVFSMNENFAYAEAFKSLRTNLDFVASSIGAKCILVTSAMQDESKTTTVINLARTLSGSGNTVVIVECDLRKPSLQKYLKLGKGTGGLSDVLSRQSDLNSAIIKKEKLGISAIHAGAIPANPSELLNQKQMKYVIAELKKQYDYVILDAPPVTVVTDAAVVGRMADGALLVVRSKFASAKTVQLAKQRLESVNIEILGAVLTRFDIKNSGWRYGYDYKRYTYNYGQYGLRNDS